MTSAALLLITLVMYRGQLVWFATVTERLTASASTWKRKKPQISMRDLSRTRVWRGIILHDWPPHVHHLTPPTYQYYNRQLFLFLQCCRKSSFTSNIKIHLIMWRFKMLFWGGRVCTWLHKNLSVCIKGSKSLGNTHICFLAKKKKRSKTEKKLLSQNVYYFKCPDSISLMSVFHP